MAFGALWSKSQMGEPDSQAGRVLGGRFRLESLLGEGGFGTIWRAEQLVLGAPVAVKLIDLSIARQAGALERFLREAQAAATLRSPHVVQIIDYGVEGDQPYIAMELLEGETLAQRLHRVGRLAPSEALRIVTHVARAVSRAHESNIVHRDLKPENVFLVCNEDDEVGKVLDFGVAKMKSPVVVDESTRTRTGSLIGTPHYMSPEQVQGNKTVDFRSDIWALGVIAFEMFTGQRPFTGNALGDLVLQICVRDIVKPSQLAPVPVGFDEWFANATDRDPDKRFQSARELAQSLREIVGGGDRDTSLVVSENMLEPAERGEPSVSAIVPSEHAASAPRLTKASLEMAPTILSPATGASVVERPTAVTHPSQARLVAAVIAAILGLGAVALGIWYQGSRQGSAVRTIHLPTSAGTASAVTSASANTASPGVLSASPSTKGVPSRRESSTLPARRRVGSTAAQKSRKADGGASSTVTKSPISSGDPAPPRLAPAVSSPAPSAPAPAPDNAP